MKTANHCRQCGKAIAELPAADAFCVSCRYTDPPPARRWDDDSASLPAVPADAAGSVGFCYPMDADASDADETDTNREATRAGLVEFLRVLTADAPALLAGQRLHLLAFLVGATDFKTFRELARALNVSPGRVSQILAALPNELQPLCRLKRREASDH